MYKASPKLLAEYRKGELVPVCPEQLGGLPTPRSGARILEGDGYDVLNGKTGPITDEGRTVTKQYVRGAYEVLKIAKDLEIKEAVFKQGSPSCGCGYTQGGEEFRKLVEGDAVTTSLLKENGIKVLSEDEF